jgi:hypothetical protein
VKFQLLCQSFAQFIIIIDDKKGFLLHHDPVSLGFL